MSEQENANISTDLDPSFFQAYANKIKEDSAKKAGTSNFAPREYDEIGYAGLESGINKIYRIIGAPPNAEAMGYTRKNYDPKQIMMCDVKDDEGKKFTIRLPLREDTAAANHIMHRLYDKVMETVWIQKKKVFVNETKYPDLWKMITKGNYTENDGKQFSMAGGFKSTIFTMMNVIDRQDDWCEKNKHTKVLCRDVNVDEKGNVWAKPGVKSFGFIKRIADLIGKYGDMQNYDVSIKRTGEKDNPFELKNASAYKEKDMMNELLNADGTVPDDKIISIGKMSEEEKAFEKYDLDKLYQPTSYTKLLKKIPALFKLTDACLGTKFYEEIEGLSEREKEEWKKLYGDENERAETAQAAVENTVIKEAVAESAKEETPKRRQAVGPVTTLTDEKISYLKGWGNIPDNQKALIKDVIIKDGAVKEIIWVDCDETKQLFSCDCNISSPEVFTTCPSCNASFI